MIRTILIASALGVGALVFFTPKGGSPESLPLLGMLATWPLGLAAGLAYTRQLMIKSQWFTNRENAFRFAFGPPGISPAGLHTSSGRSAVPG